LNLYNILIITKTIDCTFLPIDTAGAYSLAYFYIVYTYVYIYCIGTIFDYFKVYTIDIREVWHYLYNKTIMIGFLNLK